MIENKNEASRNLEKALQALEQAKQRVANEKKSLVLDENRERMQRLLQRGEKITPKQWKAEI